MRVKKKVVAFDLESDGLLDELTKLHCAVINDFEEGDIYTFTSIEDLGKFLDDRPHWMLACHNCFNFDKRALSKLGLGVKNQWIDTLGLSWYLNIDRKRHGLGDYGEEFGVPKPEIEDWHNLPLEEYVHRNKEDTEIQARLWKDQWEELIDIYDSNEEQVWKLIGYTNFKMRLLALKSSTKWKLDVNKAQGLWDYFEGEMKNKHIELQKHMPKVPIKAKRKPPAKPYKKNGELSSAGFKWKALTEERSLPFGHKEEIEVVTGYKEPNAGSSEQIKKWLFGLGWKPETFDYKKDDKPESQYQAEVAEYKLRNKGRYSKKDFPKRFIVRAIPQVNIDGGDVCPSIHKLAKQYPEVENLAGLGVLQHRKGIVKGWINNHKDGYLEARAQGFTNTLRLKHRGVVNLPSTRKPYGEELRGCLIADSGTTLLGSDLSSLEDRLKHHFQWDLDPEYVKAQMAEDFDGHCLIATKAGLMTEEEMSFYKWFDANKDLQEMTQEQKDKYDKIKKARHIGKGCSYALQYGAGVDTLVRQIEIDEATATIVRDAYLNLNWSIDEIAKSCIVKKASTGKKWQYNPINGFWYFLKTEKDKFSTLIQGSGSFIFDMWAEQVIKQCYKRFRKLPHFVADFHDEMVLRLKDTEKARHIMEDVVVSSIHKVNSELNLNRDMDVDVQFGKRYSEIH